MAVVWSVLVVDKGQVLASGAWTGRLVAAVVCCSLNDPHSHINHFPAHCSTLSSVINTFIVVDHFVLFNWINVGFYQLCLYSRLIVAQRRSIANSVGCFQRRLFVCLHVCFFINFRTSNHRMMKLGVGALYRNINQVRIWGHSPPGAHPPKCGVGIWRWENQCRLSSWEFLMTD